MKWLATACFLTLSFIGFSQMSLNEVDVNRIPQKKVREFVQNQKVALALSDFNQIQPTLTQPATAVGFHTHRANYKVKSDVSTVWQKYQNASPSESWEGKRFSFGFAFDRNKEELVYREDNSSNGVEPGQMFYVNLRLMGGVYNMAVAFEIITVDTVNRVMEFSYVEGGQSQGLQRIELKEDEDGNTAIVHTSFFKSGSKFRDAILYPYFHKRIINEFHRRMRKRLK